MEQSLTTKFSSDDDETTELSLNYRAALAWRKRGFNVVPRAGVESKRPALKWKVLQDRAITKDDLSDWYAKFSGGLGVITGAISSIVVIETDGLAGETVLDTYESMYGPLPETLIVQSGSRRGLHRYFRHPGHPVKTTANKHIKIDIRGDGGYCVLPPSLHKSGKRYEVVHDAEPAALPEGLLEFIASEETQAQGRPDRSDLPENAAAARLRLSAVELGENLSAIDRKVPSAESMRTLLQHLSANNAFEHRNETFTDSEGRIIRLGWIKTGMALKLAYGDEIGFDLWAETHIDDRARSDAPAQWASFRNTPKLGDVTIGSIIKAAKYSGFDLQSETLPLSPVATPETQESSGDVKNGKLFAGLFRDKLLYVHETTDWLKFDETQGWIAAPPGEEVRSAKQVLAFMHSHAVEQYKTAPGEEKTKKLQREVARTSIARNLHAMIDMARSEPGMTARLQDFDADPMLLGLTNGILDLRNGTLLPASPDLLVSKRANVSYDPDATCPLFLKFLHEVQPDKDIRRYLRRVVGYCLTGLTTEQIFNFFHGSGGNGKTVFVELIRHLMGDYAKKIATEMLMQHQRNPQSASPDIVGLKGVRFAFCSETEEGQRLSASRVKELTGSDTLVGREVYESQMTFQPTHKLVIVGNHKPEISDNSHGMWRRVALVGFDITIPEASRDIKLESKLRAEGPGILNWALVGLRDWLTHGLEIPDRVRAATNIYRDEMDVVGEWITERCMIGAGRSEKKDVIYENYESWATANGHHPMAQKRLTRRLGDRGYKLAADHRTITGIAVQASVFGRQKRGNDDM